MSTKLVINKDFKYRNTLNKNNINNRVLKLFCSDFYIPIEYRSSFFTIKNNSNSTLSGKPRNRCIITGRTRAVNKYCKLTRMMFKNLAVKGYLVGFKKYSW